ncbi:MAG: heterodisulfide reductase-related iron-sulfur binding cluster [Dehalococcoidia bacterium]|nr:heterodisulfide reductase-related iron-sulfur binding cluster [Dehalococcoidia bacterium]
MSTESRPTSTTRASNTSNFRGPDVPSPEDMYKCVHCGFCLQACPTYLETGLEAESPRGRIALMKAVEEGRTEITPAIVGHWDKCLQCRACEVVCPSGVPYGRLMEATRANVETVFKRGFKKRRARNIGFNGVLPDPKRLNRIGSALRLYQKSGLQAFARKTGAVRLAPGGSLEKYLPKLSDRFFVTSGQVIRPEGEVRARVAMLGGCVMRLTHGPTLEAVTRVLARNGVEVYVPETQGCCGALNAHSGERDSAREMARRNIDAFLDVETDAIIVAAAGCGSTMKEYGDLLADDPGYAERAEEVAERTKDIHEFLSDLGIEAPKGSLARNGVALKVTYQDSCHLGLAQRITAPPRQLLNAIPGVEFVEMKESLVCCGSGGTYSLFEQEMSLRLARRKTGNIVASGADIVATANPGCVIQMEQALNRAGEGAGVRYVVDLLDESYRLGDAAG